MSTITNFVQDNTSILNPLFRTTCLLLGLVILYTGLTAFTRPSTFAENFGLPLIRSTSRTSPPSTRTNTNTDTKADGNTHVTPPEAYILIFAGREVSLGITILTFLYLNEIRVLSVVLFCTYSAGLGDLIATWRFGPDGAVTMHVVPILLFSWVAPLGWMLSR